MVSEDPTGNSPDQNAPETKTGIDVLLDLLRSHGKMELGSISTTLSVNAPVVETWSKLLERNNLVHITYEVGKMYVEPVAITLASVKEEVAKSAVKREVLDHTINEQLLDLNTFSHMVEELGHSAASAEVFYKQKIPKIQLMVSEMNKINDEMSQGHQEMLEIRKKTEAEFDSAAKEIVDTISKIDTLDAETTKRSIDETFSKMDEAIKYANDSIITVDGILKSKEAETIAARKEFEDQIAKINKDIADSFKTANTTLQNYKSQIAEGARSLREKEEMAKSVFTTLKGFERKRALSVKKLNEVMSDFTDKHARIKSYMDKRMDLLMDNVTATQKYIAEMKGGFGEAADIIDRINYVKKGVAFLTEQIATSKLELSALRARLNTLSDVQNKLSLSQRQSATDELELGVNTNTERAKSIKKEIKTTTEALTKVVSKPKDKKVDKKEDEVKKDDEASK